MAHGRCRLPGRQPPPDEETRWRSARIRSEGASQPLTAKEKTRYRRQRHLHCGTHQVPSTYGTRFHSHIQASEASSQQEASECPGRTAALLLLLRPGCRHSPPYLYTAQTVSATTTGRLQSPKSYSHRSIRFTIYRPMIPDPTRAVKIPACHRAEQTHLA